MKEFSKKRKISLIAHLVFVSVPFLCSTVSALFFWYTWFASWVASSVLVGIIEIMALSSFAMKIAHIEWPLTWLRHLLPFLSIVPLGYELYIVLKPNGNDIAIILSSIITFWLVIIAFVLFRSIENLFIDPVDAAQEKDEENLEHIKIAIRRSILTNIAITNFWKEWTDKHLPSNIIDINQPNNVLTDSIIDDDMIIYWKDVDNVTFEEIGKRIGLTQQGAYAKYNRIKARIAIELSKESKK